MPNGKRFNKVAFEARRGDVVAKLTGLSDAQIDKYIDRNVTNLGTAKKYLKRLTIVTREVGIMVTGG
jgi:hypothetical protein